MIYVRYLATSLIHAVPVLIFISYIIVLLCLKPKPKLDEYCLDEDGFERRECKHTMNLTGLCIKEGENCKTFGQCCRECNK